MVSALKYHVHDRAITQEVSLIIVHSTQKADDRFNHITRRLQAGRLSWPQILDLPCIELLLLPLYVTENTRVTFLIDQQEEAHTQDRQAAM